MRRRDILALVAGTAALCPLTPAAQQKKMPVIGWLHSLTADQSASVIEAF